MDISSYLQSMVHYIQTQEKDKKIAWGAATGMSSEEEVPNCRGARSRLQTDEDLESCTATAIEDELAEEFRATIARRLHYQPIVTINMTVNKSEFNVAVREQPCKRKLLKAGKLHTVNSMVPRNVTWLHDHAVYEAL